ncbi:hypothetical protein ACHAXH_004305, partial [Discostella pseudostelligera]
MMWVMSNLFLSHKFSQSSISISFLIIHRISITPSIHKPYTVKVSAIAPYPNKMKTMNLASSLSLASLPLTAAFAPPRGNAAVKNILNAEAVVTALPSPDKPIFDPLGLYPSNSPERLAGLIQPLEASFVNAFKDNDDNVDTKKQVFDPLRLYTDQSQVQSSSDGATTTSTMKMSDSLPFLPQPAFLDGTLPGDRGFDPFNFASDDNALQWQRKAELKHGRLAMLASVGWPMAELFHLNLAETFDLPYSLASGGRVPSILNDGLAHADFPVFWIAVLSAAAAIEILESVGETQYPVEMGLDIMSMDEEDVEEKPSFFMQEAEIFNGRLGMLAITSFAIQECLQNSAVVNHWSTKLITL